MIELVFELLGRLLIEIFIHIIFGIGAYYIGWPIVKIFTLGKYPKDWRWYGIDLANPTKIDLTVCWTGVTAFVVIAVQLLTARPL